MFHLTKNEFKVLMQRETLLSVGFGNTNPLWSIYKGNYESFLLKTSFCPIVMFKPVQIPQCELFDLSRKCRFLKIQPHIFFDTLKKIVLETVN